LVPFDRNYLDRSWDWLRDPELKRLTMTPDFSREDQLAFFASLPSRQDYKIWGVETLEDEPIGAAGIKKIADGSGEFWCYIGEREWWGRKIGGQILKLCEDEARELGIETLIMVADATNERSIRAFEKQGFAMDRHVPKPGVVQLSKSVP
jgi:RimJ/RimL family protein N-acetyltransferase